MLVMLYFYILVFVNVMRCTWGEVIVNNNSDEKGTEYVPGPVMLICGPLLRKCSLLNNRIIIVFLEYLLWLSLI